MEEGSRRFLFAIRQVHTAHTMQSVLAPLKVDGHLVLAFVISAAIRQSDDFYEEAVAEHQRPRRPRCRRHLELIKYLAIFATPWSFFDAAGSIFS